MMWTNCKNTSGFLLACLILCSSTQPGTCYVQEPTTLSLLSSDASQYPHLRSLDSGASATATATTTSTSTSTALPNHVMTDATIQKAVDTWCSNPTLATKYYGPIAEWDTSQVTSFRGLFRRKTHFNNDISKWDTGHVTTMASMFEEATAFDQDLSQWDTSNVVTMSAMFTGATSFTGTQNGNSLSGWNVEKVARMDRMFRNAILFEGDLSGWRTIQVNHVANMFDGAISYGGGQDLALWNTSKFRDMSAMFLHAVNFQGNISLWDTRNSVELDETFSHAIQFDCDLSGWDTSKVVTMKNMFLNAAKFTGRGQNGGIQGWNVQNVRNFYGMFEQTPAFDADISSWKPDQAGNMERMFYNATAFGKTHTLPETITESTLTFPGQFKLLCWDLPDGQVRVQNMFCGSIVRFDPCCATATQMETSCCNRFCYNTSTVCTHPEHNLNLGNHYVASSGKLIRDDDETPRVIEINPESHARGNFEKRKGTSLGWEGMALVLGVIVVVMLCFWGLVYFFSK